MTVAFVHQTVLLGEAVALLEPGAGKLIVDGTLGGGGHAEALLRQGARVLGLDKDPRALGAARERLSGFEGFTAVQADFGDVEHVLAERGLGPVQGLLLDLGISSPQVDEPSRGFSFQHDGPLDMRMGEGVPAAAERIEAATEPELVSVLRELGEEPFARPIAKALKRLSPKTTFEAVEAVKQAVPRKAWPKKIHVATRTFQALRIWVNDELGALDRALSALPRILAVGGRAAIISFHSLEDRRVKQAFRDLEGRCVCPPGMPVCGCGASGGFRVLTKRSITASEAEVEQNPRARSAHLRAVERLR